MLTKRTSVLAGIAAVAAIGVAALTSTVTADHHNQSGAKAKVGERAPDFTLTDVSGQQHTLSSFAADGKIVVLEWFNSGCPFVVRHHEKYTTMKDTAAKYGDKVQWILINSGAPGQQGYGLDKQAAEKWKITFPILLDSDGTVGRMYEAKTTPQMFIIDTRGVLRYNGAIDNDRGDRLPKDQKVNYVVKALDEIIAGTDVSEPETQPYGCSVKYAN